MDGLFKDMKVSLDDHLKNSREETRSIAEECITRSENKKMLGIQRKTIDIGSRILFIVVVLLLLGKEGLSLLF